MCVEKKDVTTANPEHTLYMTGHQEHSPCVYWEQWDVARLY